MASNNSHQAVIDRRRLMVSQMRLRGATQREIVEQLASQGVVNPKTAKPWSLNTINLDLQAVLGQWKEDAAAEIAELKGQQLAEIRAARRTAWKEGDIAQVRHLLKLEMDLLGTEAPKRSEVTSEQNIEINVTSERNRIMANLAEKSGGYVADAASKLGEETNGRGIPSG